MRRPFDRRAAQAQLRGGGVVVDRLVVVVDLLGEHLPGPAQRPAQRGPFGERRHALLASACAAS
jgi:hypothetical protein